MIWNVAFLEGWPQTILTREFFRVQVRGRGHEGGRREKLIQRHSSGGFSCHLQEQSLHTSPVCCYSHCEVGGVRLNRSEALFPCVPQLSLVNALTESPQSLECLEGKLNPWAQGVVRFRYEWRLSCFFGVCPQGCAGTYGAVGLFSCWPQDRAATLKCGGSAICSSRAM